MSGAAVLIGGGVAQGVTAIMKGSSSVAQFAAMLGADVITDATMEFFMTKQITWEGMIFTALISTIGNAAQINQMKNAATINPAKGADNVLDRAIHNNQRVSRNAKLVPETDAKQHFVPRLINKAKNWISPIYEGNGFPYRTTFWGKKYNFKLAENDNAKVKFLIQNKKMANPHPTNLTNELERVFYYRLGIKELLDNNPNLSRVVGSLPQRWGENLGKYGLKSIDDVLYSFSKNFYNTNKIYQNDLTVLETELSKILNQKVKIKYIGKGQIGVALNITVEGQSFVLKVFKKDIQERFLHNHGNYAELSAAVYASKNDPSHFARFYVGRFGDNNDGYMITKFLQSESNVSSENFSFRNSIHKLNSSDTHSDNIIANRIIDYGATSLNYTSNFTTEEMKILRRLTEALDNNSETEVLKIIKEFENNPNFNNPKQFIKFLIDNESMKTIGSKVGSNGSHETVQAADYFKERENVLSLLGINSVPDIKVYSKKYNPDCQYWFSPDMAKYYDLTFKEWKELNTILRSE